MFDWLLNTLGRLVGWGENEGILHYPVRHYCEQVSPTLWRGARLELDEDYVRLAQNGFKCIVNLCSENDADSAPARQHGMVLIRIPIEDNTAPTPLQVNGFCSMAILAKFQPLYVHCEAGQGRTGLVVACYRIKVQGWIPQDALVEAERLGLKMPCQKKFILNYPKVMNQPLF